MHLVLHRSSILDFIGILHWHWTCMDMVDTCTHGFVYFIWPAEDYMEMHKHRPPCIFIFVCLSSVVFIGSFHPFLQGLHKAKAWLHQSVQSIPENTFKLLKKAEKLWQMDNWAILQLNTYTVFPLRENAANLGGGVCKNTEENTTGQK